MPLTRKTKLSGNSMFVTIPSQLAQAYGIRSGDIIEIIPLRKGEIKLRKGRIERYSKQTRRSRGVA